jgi:hypothetical protein
MEVLATLGEAGLQGLAGLIQVTLIIAFISNIPLPLCLLLPLCLPQHLWVLAIWVVFSLAPVAFACESENLLLEFFHVCPAFASRAFCLAIFFGCFRVFSSAPYLWQPNQLQ